MKLDFDQRLPLALAELHRSLDVGEVVDVEIAGGRDDRRADVVEGAGFEPVGPRSFRRLRTLPDTVGPQMRLLVCGLNPSLHAADAGVGFVSASNRFWKAALAAGLVTAERDPMHAIEVDQVGMTDIVKRATRRAAELTTAEYRAGMDRLDRLCAWLRPGAVCFVGLAGWRAAVDRKAIAGVQAQRLGGRPVYVMPSTSGLNAHARLDDLVQHLRETLNPS